MADRRPGAVEAVLDVLQGTYQVVPAIGLVGRQQDLDGLARFGQQLVDGRFHLFGADAAERWQVLEVEQRVVHGGCPILGLRCRLL